jgi:hypothetical protein
MFNSKKKMKMKKLKVLLALCIGTAFFSCEDSYNIIQDGEFNEAATFRTVDDMQAFLFEVYDAATIYNEIALTTIFTDESALGSANTGQNIDLFKFILNRDDGNADGIWANHYAMINYSNRLLRGAARITPTDAELSRYNSIVAQAKALRAFGHLQLMTYFSEDMQNDSSMGVILMDRVPTTDEELPRNTSGEIWAFIESDLADAQANLGNPLAGLPASAQAYQYINQDFFSAFRARMYAYRGNYTLAAQYADEAIASAAGQGIQLTPAGVFTTTTAGYTEFEGASTASDYRKMWTDAIRGEQLFGFSRVVGKESIASIWYTNRTNLSGAPIHDMGRNLFNLLADQNNDGVLSSPTSAANTTDRDVRRVAFVDRTSLIAADPETVISWRPGDVICIDKYPGVTGAVLLNDIKVFRLSEMYLIKAEAYAATGQLNGASNSVAAILKQIRDVRTIATRPSTAGAITPAAPQPLPDYGDATAAWADILLERRKELCFEGHRYIDLGRLGPLANVSIDRYHRDCEDAGAPVCTLPNTDYRFRAPIPTSEFLGNANIQQNPGY